MKSAIHDGDGVIYVAFGKAYLAQAAVSAASAKAQNPALKAAVITNVSPTPENFTDYLPFDHWFYEKQPTRTNRRYKVSVNHFSPFSRTLLMDCDTVAIGDLSELFGYLDFKDVAMQLLGVIPHYGHRDVEVLDGRPLSTLPHWNSGVLAFADRPQVHQFFDRWQRAFLRLGLNSDQPALVEAVMSSQVNHLGIDHRWNCSGNRYLKDKGSPIGDEIRIIHYMSNFLSPDVEKYLRTVDTIMTDHLQIPGRDDVTNYIDRRKAKRAESAAGLPSVNILPQDLTFQNK